MVDDVFGHVKFGFCGSAQTLIEFEIVHVAQGKVWVLPCVILIKCEVMDEYEMDKIFCGYGRAI